MTLRQRLLKKAYPVLMWATRLGNKNTTVLTHLPQPAPVSFFSLHAQSIEGTPIDWSLLRNKKVLLVNTASDCGYTGQYAALQQLQDRFADRLVIIGFPANDFKEQEKGDNASIAAFCQRNYGVRFLITQKTSVVPGPLQHPVYRWLTDPAQNGWNSKSPSWNFSKYLVDEQGCLTHYFDPSVSPLDEVVLQALK
ncbi:MAG: glutathione peroxidase [Chitinophagia bacterium]|nr:glutathione peroxidase [Chitinophagia bacterium]